MDFEINGLKITGRSTINTVMNDPKASQFLKDVLKLALEQENPSSVHGDLLALALLIKRHCFAGPRSPVFASTFRPMNEKRQRKWEAARRVHGKRQHKGEGT